MSVTFHSYVPTSLDICVICRDSPNREAVAHGTQDFHKMCKTCARAWITVNPTCPTCRAPVENIEDFVPMRQRATLWIKSIPHSGAVLPMAVVGPTSVGLEVALNRQLATIQPNTLLISSAIALGFLSGLRISRHAVHPAGAAFFYGGLITFVVILLFDETMRTAMFAE